MRMSPRQIVAAATIFGLIAWWLPRWAAQREPVSLRAGYRVPYDLSEDYWHTARVLRQTRSAGRVPVLGDSVIWGEYVLPGQSLSDALNQRGSQDRFANLGLNGLHPLAMEGLVAYGAAELSQRSVLVHVNLLWMSSPERDLQSAGVQGFNHPLLVPQLAPRIPAYQASANERLAAAVERRSGLLMWARHLRLAYFNRQSPAVWTMEHAGENPLSRWTGQLPTPSETLRHRPVPWTAAGIAREDMPWIELARSQQWRASRRTLLHLRARDSDVFVLVGPFNEYLLAPASADRYRRLREAVVGWLRDQRFPHLAPPALPSDEYGDASHPLASGYQRLADTLWHDPAFRAWLR
jgi:hypothetical protein